MVGSIVVHDALIRCATLHSMWDLKVEQTDERATNSNLVIALQKQQKTFFPCESRKCSWSQYNNQTVQEIWFGLVSLFISISTFMGYLMPKQSL